MLFKKDDILGNIIKRYPDGNVDIDYDGTIVTLPESENELNEIPQFGFGGLIPTGKAMRYSDPGVKQTTHGIRNGDKEAIETASEFLSKQVSEFDVLIPIPNRTGDHSYANELALAISRKTGARVYEGLHGAPRPSVYEIKKQGKDPKEVHFGFYLKTELPKIDKSKDGKYFVVDNVIGTGTTMENAIKAIGHDAQPLVYSVDERFAGVNANDGINILYLHGLDATPKSDSVHVIERPGINIIAPHLTYENGNGLFESLCQTIKDKNIQGIVGHSYGGYFAYCLSNKFRLPCLMFAPYFGPKNDLHPIPTAEPFRKPFSQQMLVIGSEDEMFVPEEQMRLFKDNGCSVFVEKMGHDIPDDIKVKYFDKFVSNLKEMREPQVKAAESGTAVHPVLEELKDSHILNSFHDWLIFDSPDAAIHYQIFKDLRYSGWDEDSYLKRMYPINREKFQAYIKENPHAYYANGGIVVTSIKSIPDLKKKVDAGQVTYRGLGMGKLADQFHNLAGESGVRIKVDGKEYFITDTDFRELNWDFEKGEWLKKIRFDAPHRRAEDGAEIKEHDMVTLLVDIGDIKAGTKGTVIHIYPNNAAYEVEFSKGRIITVLRDQIRDYDIFGKPLYGKSGAFDTEGTYIVTALNKDTGKREIMSLPVSQRDAEKYKDSEEEAIRKSPKLHYPYTDYQIEKQASDGSYIDYVDSQLTNAGFDVSKLNDTQKQLILQPTMEPETYHQDGEIKPAEAMRLWLNALSSSGLGREEIKKSVQLNFAKNGKAIDSDTDEEIAEKYGTVHKDQWDEYNQLYKDIIKYAPYEIPDKVAVFEGKEQASVPFFKMYGTTDHIKKAFGYIEGRKQIARAIKKAGDAEKYPDLAAPHKFQVVAITEDSYKDGYRAYANGGGIKTIFHDIKDFYAPGKFYKHKRLGYIAKYIGKGPRGKHTYYIVDTAGVPEFQVGDQFTPNEPQKWFDIVDEQTSIEFMANGGGINDNKYKVFATFHNGRTNLHKDFELLPDRYIRIGENEPTPIEDYGDWMLFEQDVTEEEAFNRYMNVAAQGKDLVREDFLTLKNGATYFIDKVPDSALHPRTKKMSEAQAAEQNINLVFLKNFENDPSALNIAATEMGDTKQPTESQVRRAMILKIGYEGFWYALKAGGESASDHIYSSSLSMDMEGPDGEDVEKVILKKFSKNFKNILITEDEIREIGNKIAKFRRRGKKIRDEKVQGIMQFLIMAEARGKYDTTKGGKSGQEEYTEQFRERIINMIIESADNENVIKDEVHFRVKQHQDTLEWMGDKECIYMLDEKYMTPERCKEQTQKEKERERKYILLWTKLENDIISRMSHDQAAADGYLVEVIGKELEKDGGHKHRWVHKINASNEAEAEKIAKDNFNETWKLSDLSFYSAKVITNPTNKDIIQKTGVKIAENGSDISIPVMDEEDYLAIHGASRQGIGDSALHKNRGGASDKVWKRIIEHQAKKDSDLINRRQKLREEYWVKVGKGELRPPTRIEKLIATAQGHPDNESVQAARRLLEKKGISWEEKAEYGKSISDTTALNWWRHTLSINQQNEFARKHLKSYEVDALIGSTAQYASADHQDKLITKIWRKEGTPAYSEWLEGKYGYGDLTDKNLGMKIYYKTHPEYTGFKEKFGPSVHEITDWGKTAADGKKTSIRYDGQSTLEPGAVLKLGQYGQYKMEVIKDLGDKIKIKNITKNYRSEPFTRLKSEYKGAILENKAADGIKVGTGVFQCKENWRVTDGVRTAVYPKDKYTEQQAIEEFSKAPKAADGFVVKTYSKDDSHRLTPGNSIEKDILDKVRDQLGVFAGNFGWKQNDRINEGYLYQPDSFDSGLVKHIPLKQGEQIFRYITRTTAIGGIIPFIKINLERGLIYFPVTEDEKIGFETRGVKANWINLVKSEASNGAEIDKKWQIKDVVKDKYFSMGMDGKYKWYESPDMGYTYSKEDAEKLSDKLKSSGYSNLEVVKYNKDWWKAADGKEIVNHPGRVITFKSKEDAKAAKKKLTDFDFSLMWEYGDAEKTSKNMLVDNKMIFENDVDFRIALNLLNLEYKDVSEFQWLFNVAWDSTPNGVPFTEDTHGPHGAAFVIYQLPYHTEEDIKKAKAWIRYQKDVVSLKVAGDYEWDDAYKSAYFRDPRVRPLKWYQIEQDERLIRKERKKGTTPTEFVDKFVLPYVAETEKEFRKKHGDKIYRMENGGETAAKGKKIDEDLIKKVERDGIVSGKFGDKTLSSVVYQYGSKMYQIATDHTKKDKKTIIDVTPDDMFEDDDFMAASGTNIDDIYKEAKRRFPETLIKLGGGTLEVELEALPNPDFDQSSIEGTIRIKKHRVKVADLDEASRVAVRFIMDNDLGSGNWSGGKLYLNNKKIGYVSYNGRIWYNDGTPMTKMAFNGTNVASTPNLTSVMGFEEFSTKLPEITSPFVGEENVIYKPKYDTYAGKIMYFKHGRKNLDRTTVAGAYIHYLYDKHSIHFSNLSLEDRKELFGKFANQYKLELF